jgi:hypothetical protein
MTPRGYPNFNFYVKNLLLVFRTDGEINPVWAFLTMFLHVNHPLSQQVKMDEITKNMIPNAHSAERGPKVQCDIHQGKYGQCDILTCKCYPCVYFDMQLLTCVGTHIYKKRCVCIIYKVQFFVMVKNQMEDDACVYLNSQMCKCNTKNRKTCVLCAESQKLKVSIFHLTTHLQKEAMFCASTPVGHQDSAP